MTRHVVFLNPIGGIGGAERILLATARYLPSSEWKASAILFRDGPLRAALTSLGVRVRILPLTDSAAALGDTKLRSQSSFSRFTAFTTAGLHTGPDLLQHTRKLRSLLHELRPDIIHSNGLKAHFLGSLAKPPCVPVVWHVHDFYSHRPLMASVLQQLSHSATRSIAISHAIQEDIGRVLPGLPCTLVYNGVDTDCFRPGMIDSTRLDVLAGLPPTVCTRVGLVATYANWKGHDIFLKAIARISPGTARFYIIGGPIYSTHGSQFSREELLGLAKSLGIADRVGFVPFQAYPADVYRSLDIVVHASTRPEPFGLTIVEAMACGRATIVSEAGGAREIFTPGVDAIGHTPGDAISLAAAMQSLIDDPDMRTTLGVNARKTVEARFMEERLSREIRTVYQEVLSNVRRSIPDRSPGIISIPSPGDGSRPVVMPKRIVYFNPVGALGGAERSLLRILSIMRQFAPQVHCHLLVGSDGPLVSQARSLGAEVEQFPLHDSIRQLGESGLRGPGHTRSRIRFGASMPRVLVEVFRTRRWIADWFDRNKPDLIHSNGLKTHLLTGLARPQNTPLLWHIRDFLNGRPLMRWSLRWLAPKATLAVANSKAVAEDARTVFGRLPVVTLYNSVDTIRFSQTPHDPATLDTWAGLPIASPETMRIGLVATYANWKGHDILLKAAAKLPDAIPYRIYIVGEPIYATPGSQFSRDELEQLAESLGIRGRVGFIPFQDDTAAVYRKLDIVVHASTRPEPFGLTIAEAMACGRAVIVSAAGGAKELFTEGHDALGHPPGDVSALASALMKLMADPELRQRLGENARRTAVARYAEEPFARDLIALYSQSLSTF